MQENRIIHFSVFFFIFMYVKFFSKKMSLLPHTFRLRSVPSYWSKLSLLSNHMYHMFVKILRQFFFKPNKFWSFASKASSKYEKIGPIRTIRYGQTNDILDSFLCCHSSENYIELLLHGMLFRTIPETIGKLVRNTFFEDHLHILHI